MLKIVQQSMQLVSILALKNIKSISKEIFGKGFFERCSDISWNYLQLTVNTETVTVYL